MHIKPASVPVLRPVPVPPLLLILILLLRVHQRLPVSTVRGIRFIPGLAPDATLMRFLPVPHTAAAPNAATVTINWTPALPVM